MTRQDARFEAERARANVKRATELLDVRERAWKAAVALGKDDKTIQFEADGMEMAAREQRFWVAQAARYAEMAGEPVTA